MWYDGECNEVLWSMRSATSEIEKKKMKIGAGY